MQFRGSRNAGTIDNAFVLWVICLIDHYQTNKIGICKAQVRNDFGEKAADTFMFYANEAAARSLINSDFILTPPGQRIVKHWKRMSDRIYGDAFL
jgi:hypothetical protein